MSSLGLPERLATGVDQTGHATGLQLQLPSIWIPRRTGFNWSQMVYSHNTILGGLPPNSPYFSTFVLNLFRPYPLDDVWKDVFLTCDAKTIISQLYALRFP